MAWILLAEDALSRLPPHLSGATNIQIQEHSCPQGELCPSCPGRIREPAQGRLEFLRELA